jgi:hypothetical protein
VAIAHQPLIDPTKAVRHMAQPFRTKHPFGFHRDNARRCDSRAFGRSQAQGQRHLGSEKAFFSWRRTSRITDYKAIPPANLQNFVEN